MESQTITVNNVDMSYITQGMGKTLLFLHGVPGTSLMWEGIISNASSHAQCIAMDLIGLGKSGKPKLDYSIEDHVLFLKGFIDALDLQDLTLVLNGWGSIVGLDYARQYPDKISGLVFTEAYLRLEKNHLDISLFFERLKLFVKKESGKAKGMLSPAFLKTFQDNPYINSESPVISVIEEYSAWLQESEIKKLLLHAGLGFLTTKSAVEWATKKMPNLTAVDLGFESSNLSPLMATTFSDVLLSWLPSAQNKKSSRIYKLPSDASA
ncbi:MAG TPA: alpha/beta fold hydrolase [Gammaproteobacteria bacterium]|nr:alpha/beta fold hydrolase [Gammaproteobacteria bacterium]